MIRNRLSGLCQHCKKPEVFKPMLFIFLSHAISPNYTEAMVYFMSDELGIEMWFFGVISMVGYVGLFIASTGYNVFLKTWPYRKTIAFGQVLLCLFGLIDLALVLKLYTYIGIPAEAFALGDNTLGNIIAFGFKMLPLLVLSAKICPDGVEATLFAAFMSISNFGNAVSVAFGSLLLRVFGVESGNYGLLWILICIQAATKLLLIPFLSMLPEKIGEDEFLAVFEALDEEFKPVKEGVDNN